jgi:putative glycosyl hydrolase-like family 15 (GHL15) protein
MPPIRPLLATATTAAVIASIALLLTTGAQTRNAALAATAAEPSIAAHWVGGSAPPEDLSGYRYVLLHPYHHSLIPELKRKNPGIKVLVYKDMSSTRSYACSGGADEALIPSGVGYCWANAHHPDWFTTDQSGNRIEWGPWGGHWQMDVGSSAYQDQWFANVLSELKQNGWDGVAIDNVNDDPSGYFGNRVSQEYPTKTAYAAATRSFLARVGPALISSGFLVLPNIQASADPSVWADWTQFTSGAVRQYWMKWDSPNEDAYFDGADWLAVMGILENLQRAGKIMIADTPATPWPDVRAMRYARASFLVGWDGGASALSIESGPTGRAHPEWMIDIGQPLGSRYQVGSAWRRNYTGGTAIVNISASQSQSVSLGGTYVTPEGQSVTSVTLRPLTGIVLRSNGSPSPGGSPPTGGSASPPPPSTSPPAAPKPKAKPAAKKRSAPHLLRRAGSTRLSPTATRSAQSRYRYPQGRLHDSLYPRGKRFWPWLRWYLGAAEFKQHQRDPRFRPPAPRLVAESWWRGLRAFLAARRPRST